MRYRHYLVGAGMSLFAGVAICSTPAMATPCTNLQSMALEQTTITSAVDNTSGTFVVPGSSQTFTGLPSFCRVTATLSPASDSSIKIEVWLPETTWNGRFLGTGGGGFQGAITYTELVSGIQSGFAATNTDLKGTITVKLVVDGNRVDWQKWAFRVAFDPYEGLVLHQITYEDDGRVRPILHRASISEMVVPYGDPTELHGWKNAFDAGEWGLGRMTQPLTLLTDDERMLREAVSAYAKERVAPRAAEMDAKAMMDPAIIKGLFDLGVMGIEVPPELGGAGSSFFNAILAVEGLAEADPSVAVLVDVQNTLVNNAILRWGSDAQKKRYMPRMCTEWVGSYALSEAASTMAVRAATDPFLRIDQPSWMSWISAWAQQRAVHGEQRRGDPLRSPTGRPSALVPGSVDAQR